MSFVCYNIGSENKEIPADKRFKELLLTHVLTDGAAAMSIEDILSETQANEEFKGDEFSPFKTEDGLKNILSELIAGGFVIREKSRRLGELYKKRKAYSAEGENTLEEEMKAEVKNFIPAAPRETVGSLSAVAPEVKKQLAQLYFICNAWISSYLNEHNRKKKSSKRMVTSDSVNFWEYVLNGIRNLAEQKEAPEEGLLAAWKELGIDFSADEDILALRKALEAVEKKVEGANAKDKDLARLEGNRIVSDYANKALGEKGLGEILPGNKMYQPVPPGGGKTESGKPDRFISRLLTLNLDPDKVDDEEIINLTSRMVSYIRAISLPSRFLKDQKLRGEKEKIGDKEPRKAAADDLYQHFLPKGGFMNMAEFLTTLLSLVNEASPTIKIAEKDGKKAFTGIPKEEKNMIGTAKPGIVPVGSAPNAPRQRDNLMVALGRRIPDRILTILQTGFPVWFNHALNTPLTPPGKVIPPTEDAIQRVTEQYGEPSEKAKEAANMLDPSASGFFDQSPHDEMDKAMTGIAVGLAYVHAAGEHKDNPAMLALWVASTAGAPVKKDKNGKTIVAPEVAKLQKAKPEILVYRAANENGENLYGRHGKDGKIVWHNEKDEDVAAPDDYDVLIDINNYDLFGEARRLSPQIDADYAYLHLHLVQWPVETMMGEREALVNQILGTKGLETAAMLKERTEAVKQTQTTHDLTDNYRGRIQKPVAIAAGFKLLNNYIAAYRGTIGKTGGLIDEFRERGLSDNAISGSLWGIDLDGDFNAAVDKKLADPKRTMTIDGETLIGAFPPAEGERYTAVIRHMLQNMNEIDQGNYDFSNFLTAARTEVVEGILLGNLEGTIYTLNALDDRYESMPGISANWPGARNPKVSAISAKFGISEKLVDEERSAGGEISEKPREMVQQLASYDMLRSLVIDSVTFEPPLASLRKGVFGNWISGLEANRGMGNVLGYYDSYGRELAGSTTTYGKSTLFHEFGHALDAFLGGYVQSFIDNYQGAGENDISLHLMDEEIKAIQKGKKLKGKTRVSFIMRAFYRLPYFEQFMARSPDEVFALLDKDRPREETMKILKAAADKARKNGKDAQEAARRELNRLVGDAITANLFSAAFQKGAFSSSAFGGSGTVHKSLLDFYNGKRDAKTREEAMNFLRLLILGKVDKLKSHEQKVYYWASAREFFARSFQSAYRQKAEDMQMIVGGGVSHGALLMEKSDDRLVESDPNQSRRLLTALGQMFEGVKAYSNTGAVDEFYTTDLSAFLHNATPDEVMDAVADEVVYEIERTHAEIPTAMRPHIPPHQRRIEIAAYGEEAVFYVQGDNFGEFNTIGRVPTETADKLMQALTFVPDGVKTPIHAYAALKNGGLGMKDEQEETQVLRVLGDWLRQQMDGDTLKKKAEESPLPEMELYHQNYDILENAFGSKETPHESAPVSREYIPVREGMAFGKALTPARTGMEEQNAPKPSLWTEAELAKELGLTIEELEEAMFPNGVGGPASLDTIQFEAVMRFLQWTATAPEYKVRESDHQAQIFIASEKIRDVSYIPGFIEALGTGVGKTYIHAVMARVRAIAARKKADKYLKENNPKNLTHDQLWKEDGEYRKIVSEGVSVVITGGAEQSGLNRGMRKALVDLKILPKKVGDNDTLSQAHSQTPIIKGVDNKWRYINAPYFAKTLRPTQKERDFVPRVGDFIFYETYQSLVADSYRGKQRAYLPRIANAERLAVENEHIEAGEKFGSGAEITVGEQVGIRMSTAIEPGKNFRRLLYMLGIDGSLEEIPYNKRTGNFDADPDWKRERVFYDFDRYNEWQGTIIFDEADNMSGIRAQNYGGRVKIKSQDKKFSMPAYKEEIDDITDERRADKPSSTGIMGRELTRLFPRSRVVFGTATPFRQLASFASMERAIMGFFSGTEEDAILSMLARIQKGGTQAILDFLSDMSERGSGIRGNLPPPPSDLRNMKVSEEEESLYESLHYPLLNILSKTSGQWEVLLGKQRMGYFDLGELNKMAAAALTNISPMIGEALLMSGAWGREIEAYRAGEKEPDKEKTSVLVPSESIGTAHDEEVIEIDTIRSWLLDGTGRIEWQNPEKTTAIAPANLFSLEGRVRRAVSNTLPMFEVVSPKEAGDLAKVDALEGEVYNEGEKTLNMYELFIRGKYEVSRSQLDRVALFRQGKQRSMRNPKFAKLLLSNPNVKINNDGDIVFTLNTGQKSGFRNYLNKMGMTEEAKFWMDSANERKFTKDEIRKFIGERWGIKNFGDTSMIHIRKKANAIAIGIKDPEMEYILRESIMGASVSGAAEMQTAMTQLQAKFGDDYIEVSGRNWTQKPNPADKTGATIILTRRNPGDENPMGQTKFQEREGGAVLFGNPDSMGRGLDFDWQEQREVDGVKNNKNQTPRVMMIANPSPKAQLMMQVFGRIKRRSTVDLPNAAHISLVTSNLSGMRVRGLRVMNLLMRLNELSSGDAKQALRDAGIQWSMDPHNIFTAKETESAVMIIGAQRKFGMGADPMTFLEILQSIGVSTKEFGVLKNAPNVVRVTDNAIKQLFNRTALLPQHVAQDLLNVLARGFRDAWNLNPDKSRSAILDGNIKPIASMKGVPGIAPNGILHIFNYQHAPANQKFESIFALPAAMKDMDAAEADQILDQNHVFYRIKMGNEPSPNDRIIAIDFLREREGVNINTNADRQYRVYEFSESGSLAPIQMWKTKGEIMPKSVTDPEKFRMTRKEAREAWKKGVENKKTSFDYQLIYALQGNPANFSTPGGIAFTPAMIPDPLKKGEFVSAYILDNDYFTIFDRSDGENWMSENISSMFERAESPDEGGNINDYAKKMRESVEYVRKKIEEGNGSAMIVFPLGRMNVTLRETAPDKSQPDIKMVGIGNQPGETWEGLETGFWRAKTGVKLKGREKLVTTPGERTGRTLMELDYGDLAQRLRLSKKHENKSLEQYLREIVVYLGFPITDEELAAQEESEDDGVKAKSLDKADNTKGDNLDRIKTPPSSVIDAINIAVKQEERNWRKNLDSKQERIWKRHVAAEVVWDNAGKTGFFPNSAWNVALMDLAFNAMNKKKTNNPIFGKKDMSAAKEVFMTLANKNVFSDAEIMPFIEAHMPPEKMAYAKGFYDLVMLARHHKRISDGVFPHEVEKELKAIAKAYDVPISDDWLPYGLSGRTSRTKDGGETSIRLSPVVWSMENRDSTAEVLLDTVAHELWHAIADIPPKKWGMADEGQVQKVEEAAVQFWKTRGAGLWKKDVQTLPLEEQTAYYVAHLATMPGTALRWELMRAAGKDKGFEAFLERVIGFFRAIFVRLHLVEPMAGDENAAAIFQARRKGKKGGKIPKGSRLDERRKNDAIGNS